MNQENKVHLVDQENEDCEDHLDSRERVGNVEVQEAVEPPEVLDLEDLQAQLDQQEPMVNPEHLDEMVKIDLGVIHKNENYRNGFRGLIFSYLVLCNLNYSFKVDVDHLDHKAPKDCADHLDHQVHQVE